MKVLVATPARVSTPPALLQISEDFYQDLTWANRERALYLNDYPPAEGTYQNNARARNDLIEAYLKPSHSHVLWFDVDLVDAPNDLIEQLASITTEDIIAPFVLIEKNGLFPPERFYDIGGFVQDGQRFSFYPPYCAGGNLVELDSVGSCYLIPAAVYRRGARYNPIGDDVEHVSLMEQARKMSYRVFARRDMTIFHAFLPKYGERLH